MFDKGKVLYFCNDVISHQSVTFQNSSVLLSLSFMLKTLWWRHWQL